MKKDSKKVKKEFEIWANKKLEDISHALLLNNFRILPISASKDTTSYSHNRYPYKEISIGYGTGVYEDWLKGDKKEAVAILIHEVVHALTDPLYHVGAQRYTTIDDLANSREELTDHIANIIIKHNIVT